MAYSTFTLLDNSGEKTVTRIYNGDITAVSIAGFLTQFGNLRNAIDAITLGTLHKEAWTGDDTVLSQVLPESPWAQRELKLMVTYQGDTSNKLYQIEIGTVDLEALTIVPGSDLVVLDDDDGEEGPGPMAEFVEAFEALARTPDSSEETVTVIRARIVGRNI